MDGRDSVNSDGEKSSLSLIAELHTLVSTLLFWYNSISIGQLALIWNGATLTYATLAMICGIPAELATMIGSIPTAMAIFSLKRYHETNFHQLGH